MVSRSFVLGYHGCDATVARKITSGDDQLIISNNKYDWLGSGQYSGKTVARAQFVGPMMKPPKKAAK
jgi:hypothetical protein